MRGWSGGGELEGKVREVAASADAVTRTYSVKVAIDAATAPALGATVYARPKALSHSGTPVLKLPTSALRQEGSGSAVWVLDPASLTVRSQPVQVATADGNEAVIASGLAPGMLVVAAGVHVLSPGQKVSIYRDKSAAGGAGGRLRPLRAAAMSAQQNADTGKAGFNLSKWALEHAALTRYLMLVLMLLGFASYFQLGQDEDPPFTFRAMVVRTYWPGATAQQVAEQVTDKLERTLQEAPYADKIRSYSKPGESQIIFEIKDSSKAGDVRATSGTRCARRFATCARRCPPACRGRSSTTISAMSTA